MTEKSSDGKRLLFREDLDGNSVRGNKDKDSKGKSSGITENNGLMGKSSTSQAKFNENKESFSNSAKGNESNGSSSAEKMSNAASKSLQESRGTSSPEVKSSGNAIQDNQQSADPEEYSRAAGESLQGSGKKSLGDSDSMRDAGGGAAGKKSKAGEGLPSAKAMSDSSSLGDDSNKENDFDADALRGALGKQRDANSTFAQLLRSMRDGAENMKQGGQWDGLTDKDKMVDDNPDFGGPDSVGDSISPDTDNMGNPDDVNNNPSSGINPDALTNGPEDMSDSIQSNAEIDEESDLPTNMQGAVNSKGPKTQAFTASGNAKRITAYQYPSYNESLTSMINAGADAMSNMFDVYIVQCKDNKWNPIGYDGKELAQPRDDEFKAYDIFDATAVGCVLDAELLSTRIESITIPGRSRGTFELAISGTSMVKPSGQFNFENKASMSIRMDTLLTVHKTLTTYAMTSQGCRYYANPTPDESMVPNTFWHAINSGFQTDIIVRRAACKYLYDGKLSYSEKSKGPDGTPVFTEKRMIGAEERMAALLWLDAHTNKADVGKYKNRGDVFDTKSNYPDKMNDFFIFQNVRFIGSSDLEFERESSGPQSISYEFIFQNLIRQEGNKEYYGFIN